MWFIRLCSASISALIFVTYVFDPVFLLRRFTPCGESWLDSCDANRIWFYNLSIRLKVLITILWICAWILLEIRTRKDSIGQRSSLLTHLRYGPIAVMLLSIAAIIFSDQLLIQFSRWQIVRYIYSNASPFEKPSFKLHNNDRGFCGNGVAAHEYYLYGQTPESSFSDPDPAVRARALRASIDVYDWINQPGDGPTINVLRKALEDQDPMVRRIAAEYQDELLTASTP